MIANHAGEREQLDCVVEGERLDRHRGEQRSHHWLLLAFGRILGSSPLHVWAKLARLLVHGEAHVLADRIVELWSRENLECDIDGEFVGRHAVGDCCSEIATADVRAELSWTRFDDFTRLGMRTHMEGIQPCGIDVLDVVFDEWLQAR